MRAPATSLLLAILSFGATAQTSIPDPGPREPGLSARFYYVGEPLEKILPLLPGQTPNVSRIQKTLDLADGTIGDFDSTFLAHVEGFLEVRTAGKHTLRLTSDDGSKLSVDGRLAIDHDGLHSPKPKSVELELQAGLHPLDLWFFQCYGGWTLKLEWKTPGSTTFEIVPESALSCHAGEVRVTAPGPKRVVKPLAKGRPGDGQPVEALNPALEIATVRPAGFEPRVGGIAWLPDGRMLVTTWDEIGAVYVLDGTAGDDRAKIRVKRFAAGLAEPLGIAVVEGRVFVLQKQELTELVDRDSDGVADEYKCVCNGWDVSPNFHEFAFGLVFKDGWFYFNLAIAIDPGGKSTKPQVPGRGSTLRVRLSDGALERVAHGLRTPNGIGLGPNQEIFLTDNQGDWLPSSKLLHLESGAFYGSQAVLLEKARDLVVTPPVLWMPQNEIGNSPSNPALIPSGWGPYSGQLCHGDVTHGGVKRDALEVIDGVWQGCILDWTQGLESGVNRIAFGPDGKLYVGGIGSTGNWGQEGKLRFGLQRLAYAGRPAFEILAMRARSNGFEVEFTEPLAPGVGWDPLEWRVEQWRYVPTTDYGGPKVDTRALAVGSVAIASDRRRAFLRIEGLTEGHVVHLHVVGPLTNEAGAALWSTEAWYTLNRIPKSSPGFTATPPPPAPQNVLSEAERAAGWTLLFDGRTTQHWRGYKKDAVPPAWRVVDGALVRGDGEAGDLVTREEYQDFELSLDWKLARGGNSGIFFHVGEDHAYPWETGPEMQILDNDVHPDGRNPLTSAGANYALDAPLRDVTRPVGMWNQVRIRVQGSRVEHWLNGTRTASYDLWSDAWKAAVAASKFASMPDYGTRKTGRIALQDHGDFVAFRNIKIRRL